MKLTRSGEEKPSEIGTIDVSTNKPVRISFSAAAGSVQFDNKHLASQGAQLLSGSEVYSQHAVITLGWTSGAKLPISVKVLRK